MAHRTVELPFIRSPGASASEGWVEESLKCPYIAFDPEILTYNDTLFNELLLSAHAIKTNSLQAGQSCSGSESAEDCEDGIEHQELATFIGTAAEVFALDRQCLVCRVLDIYKHKFGLSAIWMADYAFLCSKCLGSPPCATTMFIAAFEFVYIMDKHFLVDHGCTLVGSFGRKHLTFEDIQRHFFLHGCFRTDGGVPGRRHNEVIVPRANQGRSAGKRGRSLCAGDAKVLYSNYSYLAQSATRAMLTTVSDMGHSSYEGQCDTAAGHESKRKVPQTGQTVGSIPTSLSVALAGWKDCARSVECNFSQTESCIIRALSDDDIYERELQLRLSKALPDGENDLGALAPCTNRSQYTERSSGEDSTMGYTNLVLLLLSGTGSAPDGASELALMAAKFRKETVSKFWKDNRIDLARGATRAYSHCYEDDSEPDLELGPLMVTQLKHAITKGGTSAECLLCNFLLIRTYWLAMRQFKRDIIAYSANNIGIFHSIEPVLEAWGTQERNADFEDDGYFVALLKGTGTEAIYKHFFCDPMCAARIAQTNPRSLFDHPDLASREELALHKARLASHNRFEGRVCAGFWALAYTFKTYQVFPPRPTTLSAFVKDAGAFLQRHSISLISLEHTLQTYV
ncbi:UL32 protein [Gallid alphaherpesvirus 3]|uniref:Packaging protein UL32 n=1 Tax=Gallid alphaherpesvirus 3 TaxID=35250 RepID=F8TC27_9ALPH|nr:UL32 protein [Gallid alphaherpesvirus 3]AEI00238.1 UL32 protein [Gallid alphaherpesvirus 3]QEY02231.1 UL32 protein [Gallid alphaherpesvirus 3]